MIPPDLKRIAAPFERTSRIIWVAFIVAPVLYGVMAWLITQGGEKRMGSGEMPSEAIYVAVLLAVASGVVLPFVLAPRFFGPAKMKENPDLPPAKFDGESAVILERLGQRDRDRAQLLGAIQASLIVRWAGAESVAIYGLLALMLGVADLNTTWAFCLGAMVLLWILRPNYERDLENL